MPGFKLNLFGNNKLSDAEYMTDEEMNEMDVLNSTENGWFVNCAKCYAQMEVNDSEEVFTCPMCGARLRYDRVLHKIEEEYGYDAANGEFPSDW